MEYTPIPLAPALSPGERENGPQPRDHPCRSLANSQRLGADHKPAVPSP